MLQSKLVDNNPNLYAFLPVFYMVWSDAVLTPSEIKVIQGVIHNQHWLNDEEKKFLLAQVDPASPPTAEQLKNWREEIRKVAIAADSKESLAEIGVRLAHLHGNGTKNDILKNSVGSLTEIEAALGMISREAASNFLSTNRNTATSTQSTRY